MNRFCYAFLPHHKSARFYPDHFQTNCGIEFNGMVFLGWFVLVQYRNKYIEYGRFIAIGYRNGEFVDIVGVVILRIFIIPWIEECKNTIGFIEIEELCIIPIFYGIGECIVVRIGCIKFENKFFVLQYAQITV